MLKFLQTVDDCIKDIGNSISERGNLPNYEEWRAENLNAPVTISDLVMVATMLCKEHNILISDYPYLESYCLRFESKTEVVI